MITYIEFPFRDPPGPENRPRDVWILTARVLAEDAPELDAEPGDRIELRPGLFFEVAGRRYGLQGLPMHGAGIRCRTIVCELRTLTDARFRELIDGASEGWYTITPPAVRKPEAKEDAATVSETRGRV
jgi:hypothetical protein